MCSQPWTLAPDGLHQCPGRARRRAPRLQGAIARDPPQHRSYKGWASKAEPFSGSLFRCKGTEIQNHSNIVGSRLMFQAFLSAFYFGIINSFLSRVLLLIQRPLDVGEPLVLRRYMAFPPLRWLSLWWSVHLCWKADIIVTFPFSDLYFLFPGAISHSVPRILVWLYVALTASWSF